MSGEQRIDEKRLAEIEARSQAATSGKNEIIEQRLADIQVIAEVTADEMANAGPGAAGAVQLCEYVLMLIGEVRAARSRADRRFAEGRAAGIEAMREPMNDQRRLGAEEEREACAKLCDAAVLATYPEEPGATAFELAQLIRARGGAS